MSYELVDSNQTPPCGWTYVIPETGLEVEGDGLVDLLEKVKANMVLNDFPYSRAKIYPLVMESICARSPSGICRGFVNNLIARSRAVMNGTIAMTIMLKRGKGAFVSNEVAEARAAICADCVFNIDNPGCSVCKGFDSIIKRGKGGRITTRDAELKTCGICKCFIQVLVHVDIDVLVMTTSRRNLKYLPAYCWKGKTLKEIDHANMQK